MDLGTVWFWLVAFFWTGYLVLEGFDFGVGVLARLLGRSEDERGVLLETIGPFWDGNEVWLVVAGGAMFAAFPAWYASLTSAYYLPLVVILVALIGRGVALEWRGERDDPVWRRRCDLGVAVGSLVPPFAWGVALAGSTRGAPLDDDGEYAGGVFGVLQPYAVLGGLALLALCLLHGAVFLRLRTDGDLRNRVGVAARRLVMPAVVLAGAFGWWTAGWAALAVVLPGLGLAGLAGRIGRDGWAFFFRHRVTG